MCWLTFERVGGAKLPLCFIIERFTSKSVAAFLGSIGFMHNNNWRGRERERERERESMFFRQGSPTLLLIKKGAL